MDCRKGEPTVIGDSERFELWSQRKGPATDQRSAVAEMLKARKADFTP